MLSEQLNGRHVPTSGTDGHDVSDRRRGHDQTRQALIAAIAGAMSVRGLSQVQAARLCGTDQPTLSKVLRGRTASVTVDKLVDWLLSLGRSIEIRIGPTFSQVGVLTATDVGEAAESKARG